MEGESLALIESQKQFCSSLIDKVLTQECFILLSGDSGSGRTVVCEYVVNETDSKLRAVFIPCTQEMQLYQLRDMFLHQLLPNTKIDTSINLADAVAKVQIPHDQKILVVVDDVDSVQVSFYNELIALYEQFLGQERFAFILVGHTLWAEEKMRSYMGKVNILSMQIPALTNQEALALSRHRFALQNCLKIYNGLSNKLPAALAPAKGNLSQIITITEKLMKEPNAGTPSTNEMSSNRNANAPVIKKKGSSAGIFVSVVCIVIVLACLVPILMGGNFLSSDTSDTTAVAGANNDALVFNEQGYEVDNGQLPSKVPTGLDAPTHDASTEHSVTLSGEELDKIEGGANNSGYPRGVDRSLKQDKENAANAAALALGLEEEEIEVQQPTLPVLKRARNINHASSVPSFVQNGANEQQLAAQTQTPAQEPKPNPTQAQVVPPDISAQVKKNNEQAKEEERAKLEAAAKQKLEADRKLAAAAKAKEEQEQAAAQKALQTQKAKEQAASAQPSRPPLRAGQIINLADEQRQLEAQKRQAQNTAPRQPARVSGNAFEGQVGEISHIANSHYTVQIVSASNRANISAAAQGLNGKYWILETRRNGRPWYVLCSGDYASRNEAMQAAATIPRSVSQGASPFAKSIADLKAEFRL